MKKFGFLFFLSVSLLFTGFSQAQISSFKLSDKLMKAVNDTTMPPTGLNATVTNNNVLLTWGPPNDGPGEWFSYSDSTTSTLIGLTDGGTWNMAARWDTQQLDGFDGEYVSKVEFLAGSALANFTLKIWQGNLAETLVYEQEISGVDSLTWNEITLDQPLQIDAYQELWVGFQIQQSANQYPIGVDFGPAVIGFGDLIEMDPGEWVGLNSFGLDFNWNLRAFITQNSSPSTKGEEFVLLPGRLTLNDSISYNVYRNQEKLNETPISSFSYTDTGLENGLYTYEVTAVKNSIESASASVDVIIGGPELSIEPDSLIVAIQSDSTLQLDVMLKNTGEELLEWSADPQSIWLTLNDTLGEIEPGDSAFLTLNINAEGLLASQYSSVVQFTTNNLNNPESYLYLSLLVSGNSAISFSQDSLFFGDVILGQSQTQQLLIQNSGSDDLLIANIESTDENFTINETAFYLSPGEYAFLDVTFLPVESGQDLGRLLISSNDPLQPEVEIYLEGNGTLAPPLNLQANVEGNEVTLSWLDPSGGPGTWLFYGNGSISTAIGLTEGGTWQLASRWDADQLSEFSGEYLVKTQFYFYTGVAEYTLKIWTADSIPTLVYDQYIGLIEDSASWNEVFLSEPFLIDGETDLLIGYEINQEMDAFPAGVDEGPAIYNYGDLISLDGISWGTISDFGLNYNWSIQAFVTGEEETVMIPKTNPQPQTIFDNIFNIRSTPTSEIKSTKKQAELLGYFVYRNDYLITDNFITDNFYTDTITEAGTYEYTVSAFYDEGESAATGPVSILIDSLTMMIPSGWRMVETNIEHRIAVPAEILNHSENSLRPGDFLGIFFNHDDELVLAGMGYWNGTDSEVIAYGDHNLTPEKDGFAEGEEFIWEIYRPQEEKAYLALPFYDEGMQDFDGKFVENGLSGLKALKINALNTDENLIKEDIILYPNPATSTINIRGIPQDAELIIYNFDGRKITQFSSSLADASIDISNFSSGLYQLVILAKGNAISKIFLVN